MIDSEHVLFTYLKEDYALHQLVEDRLWRIVADDDYRVEHGPAIVVNITANHPYEEIASNEVMVVEADINIYGVNPDVIKEVYARVVDLLNRVESAVVENVSIHPQLRGGQILREPESENYRLLAFLSALILPVEG